MTTDIIHDQDQDKRIHLFLAETFMNLGNAYKFRAKYEKAENYYTKSHFHYQRAFKPQEKKKKKDNVHEDEQSSLEESNNQNEKEIIKKQEELISKEKQTTENHEEIKKKKEEEAIKKMEEANRKLMEDQAKFLKHQEELKKETGHGFFPVNLNLNNLFKTKKKEEETTVTISEIGLPTNVTHEGHIGFDKGLGEFQTRNLPPEYQKLFDNLNQTLKSMGVSGITEKEAKLLLRSLPVVMADKSENKKSVTHHSVIIQSPKPLTIEEKLKEKEKETKELKKILDQLNKEKNDLEITKKKLEAEILQLKTKLEQRDELKHPTKNNKKFDSKLEEVTRTFTDELDKVKRQLEVKQAEVEVLHEENQKLQEKLEKLDGSHTMGNIVTSNNKTQESIPEPPPLAPTPPPLPNPTHQRLSNKSVLNKTTESTGDARQALMDAIKGPQKLRHVDNKQSKFKQEPIDVDDQNVLNLIAKALIERRNKIKQDNDEEQDDNLQEWL